MLSAVADFKAPVFEPGGSMQQGMYTPKGRIFSWRRRQDFLTDLKKKVTDVYKSVVTDFTEVSGMVKADVTRSRWYCYRSSLVKIWNLRIYLTFFHQQLNKIFINSCSHSGTEINNIANNWCLVHGLFVGFNNSGFMSSLRAFCLVIASSSEQHEDMSAALHWPTVTLALRMRVIF